MDTGVDMVGKMHLNFSTQDLRLFKHKKIDGITHWRLEYDLLIFLAPSDGLLSVCAITKGNKEVGATTLVYESELN